MPSRKPSARQPAASRAPQGQFVAIYDNTFVGYCATFRISEKLALKPHDWEGITGRGYAARQHGTVQNLKDRRFDLYNVTWKDAPMQARDSQLRDAAD